MRRDIELLSSILSFMQDHKEPTQCCKEIEIGAGATLGHDWATVRLHLALLNEMGLVTECSTPAEYRLTSIGYELIESADPLEKLKHWARLSTTLDLSQSTSRHPLPPALHSSKAIT